MALLNIKGEDNKLLLICYIISLFISDISKPILLLHGEQGGAKSTQQEMIGMLVDPSSTKTLLSKRFKRVHSTTVTELCSLLR